MDKRFPFGFHGFRVKLKDWICDKSLMQLVIMKATFSILIFTFFVTFHLVIYIKEMMSRKPLQNCIRTSADEAINLNDNGIVSKQIIVWEEKLFDINKVSETLAVAEEIWETIDCLTKIQPKFDTDGELHGRHLFESKPVVAIHIHNLNCTQNFEHTSEDSFKAIIEPKGHQTNDSSQTSKADHEMTSPQYDQQEEQLSTTRGNENISFKEATNILCLLVVLVMALYFMIQLAISLFKSILWDGEKKQVQFAAIEEWSSYDRRMI